jgi:hypothetical protein
MVCTLAIPVFQKLRQEDHEFEVSLAYIIRHCLNMKKKERRNSMKQPKCRKSKE